VVTASPSTRRSISSRVADFTDLTPVDRAEFAAEIAPALTLVAPSGMGQEERTTWLRAAHLALDGIPIALLQRGVREAMKTADHPAKLVPAIRAAVDADWQWRRMNATSSSRPIPLPAPIETDEQRTEREEVAQLMRGLRLRLEAKVGEDDAR